MVDVTQVNIVDNLMNHDRQVPLFHLDGIVSTMKAKAGPAYRVLETMSDYEKFLAHTDHSIIGMSYILFCRTSHLLIITIVFTGYFDSEAARLKAEFIMIANQLSEKFRFAYTTNKEIIDKAGQSK
jgi:hypothetical protein